jgi:hypothetical protein
MAKDTVDEADNGEMADFSLPEEVEELGVPKKLEFAPWHKPRKQYVRKFQWVHHARGIIAQLREAGNLGHGTPLKYLTLPGPDLLDVRLLADVCSHEEIPLQYTGFCHASESDAERLRRNIHQFSIEHEERITRGSEVHTARIEDVAVKRSEAETLMQRNGPFDIINLDACSPIANDNHERSDRLINAVRKIVHFQLNNSRRPWMLYLTTPFQTDSVSEQSLESLHTQITENAKNDEDFAVELSAHFLDGEGIKEYLARTSQLNGSDFVASATLGLSKWFVHLAAQANYSVKKLEGYCYSLFAEEPFEPNMISVCYLFLPDEIPIIDGTGLTPNDEGEVGAAPISDHLRALRRSLNLTNLDDLMLADSDVRTSMIDETKALLRTAGYNVDHPTDGYEAWLVTLPMECAQAAQ